MPRVQWAGRCPSATARSTAGGTHGHLDLERDPLMYITEEWSKENPKLQRSQPITTEYGESTSRSAGGQDVYKWW